MHETEQLRLAALQSYQVMDTAPEPTFDQLTMLAARVTGAPIALLTFIDAERVWIKSAFGAMAAASPRPHTICDLTIAQQQPLILRDTILDGRQAGVEARRYGPIRFYAGVPLTTPAGRAVGTICVMDMVPRPDFGDLALAALCAIAALAMDLLEARRLAVDLQQAAQAAVFRRNLFACIARATGPATAMEGVVQMLGERHGATTIGLWRRALPETSYRRIRQHRRLQGGIGWARDAAHDEDETPLPLDRSTAMTVAASGADTALFAALTADAGWQAALVVPLLTGVGDYSAVLGFDTARSDLADMATTVAALIVSLNPALERKSTEARLRLLGSALDLSPDGVSISVADHGDRRRRLVYVNQGLCRMTGYGEAELIGQSPLLLLGDGADPSVGERLVTDTAAGRPGGDRLAHYRKDGTEFSAETAIAPVTGDDGSTVYWIAVRRDVSMKIAAEAREQALSTSFRLLFEGNPLPMLVFDRRRGGS